MTLPRSRALVAALGLAVLACRASAQAEPLYKDKSAAPEARVDDLLPRLTAEEKMLIIGGDTDFSIMPVARLGIPEVRFADGPLGVRNWGFSPSYPSTAGLAASWDTNVAERFGSSIASDARARGVGVMLGPAVNIMRVPVNGRNFEYMSEDPYLAGIIATDVVKGMQEGGVVATVKHFAANNQEIERGRVDARVSVRAMEEIYLPAFKAAVQEGHAWSVMSAYNKLNGTYCSANDWLNNKVLKGDWGFKGVLMSDWGAAHDTLGVTNGGLDLEMPSGAFMNPKTLAPLLASGKVAQATIDDKVRRILRMEISMGFLDRPQEMTSTPKDDPKSAATALQIAREAVVLLKNDREALPLASKNIKRIVVLGPNADSYPAGGGSAHSQPFHYVSVLDGLRKVAGSKVKIDYIPGVGAELLDKWAKSSSYEGPLSLTFKGGTWQTGFKDLKTVQDARIDHDWSNEDPVPGVPLKTYQATWKGSIRPTASGNYTFVVRGQGGVFVSVDNRNIITSWFCGGDILTAEVSLEAGKSYPVEVNVNYDDKGSPAVQFGWGATPPLLTDDEAERVRKADAVVACVGYNLALEGEGSDRTYELPVHQPDLIRKVAALNPRTVVVVNSGGSFETAGWIDKVPAVLEAWYPGQEGGRALAEILLGKVNPSGKLPVTFEKAWKDTPSLGNYPGTNLTVNYAEDILVGYRWFDTKGVAPLFPFGFGLSYTTFHYDKMHVAPTTDGHWAVTFDVTNNGTQKGAEISEVYVSPPVTSKVMRPVRELKGFSREELDTDQTITITVVLDRSAFSHYDEKKGDWAVEPGIYTVEVGSSSRKFLLSGSAEVD
ncbi:MAG TPA: glycoside hydrolase family 3 C-terminal domain-containing protein [Opitutaceae bacterium]|nr:glycoside hydrolase family 3 C-terminal domain-containing protein [Opitutaceae bacterium]